MPYEQSLKFTDFDSFSVTDVRGLSVKWMSLPWVGDSYIRLASAPLYYAHSVWVIKWNRFLPIQTNKLIFEVLLTVHFDIIVQSKPSLMHNLYLVYFFNLYMFRTYLGPSSGGTTVCILQLVLIILFRWLSVVLVGLEFESNQDNRQSSKMNNKYQL